MLNTFFMATVIFSTAILGLLAVGTLYQIASGFDIMMLGGTFGALAYKRTDYEFYIRSIDSILPANIAHILRSRKSQEKMLFTQDESRNIIDWLEDKFNKQKTYINFFINTAMLIGLLGTFVGLVEAIDHMGQIILSLNDDIDIKQIMQDFSGPISGMAIGFGASLFGVVAAVILDINGYILFRYQDTLIDGIEDWLKDRIIDIVPNSLGAGSPQGGTALPEQRKSFMDVFIEQMENFTTQISRMSESNSAITVMSGSLESIKQLMESQRESMHAMLERQERHYENFEAFTRAFIGSKERSDAAIQDMGANMASIEKSILAQNESVASLGSMGERAIREQDRKHMETIEVLNALNSAISNETRVVSTFVAASEEKNRQITIALDDISSSSRAIEQRINIGNQALMTMINTHEKGYEALRNSSAILNTSVTTINESIKNQTTAFNNFATTQDSFNGKYILAQTQIREVMDSTLSLISKEQESLSSLLTLQNSAKQDLGKQFADTIASVSEINKQLTNLKLSIDGMVKIQSEGMAKQIYFNDTVLPSVKKADEYITTSLNNDDTVISISKDNLNAQKESFAKLADGVSQIASEIVKLEEKISEYTNIHNDVQAGDAKIQEDRYKTFMDEFALQTANTQETLRQIVGAIDRVGEKISELEISVHETSDKKGFFSSLFGKN
ncbi:MAG: MotA/TolQ/ExbB proton channel family protein [Campylobacteraceae bacterium]|nr:MotA/TolQ/ExbB proton channel family protein [Campylobacteraceae bacterium]